MNKALILMTLALTACGDKGDDSGGGGGGGRAADIAELTGDPTAGGTTYDTLCVSCHAKDGSGGTGASLIGYSDKGGLINVLLNGNDEGMTSYDYLTDQEIADVVAYVIATF